MADLWALQHEDGTWRSPDHFISSRVGDSKQAKPFFGESGKFYAHVFAKASPGSKVVPHPHPERWP